ncbi:hypothetical protein BS50DRAFT_636434 [Corynespora cassiicola Philippines]|uniref:YggU-like protein n=1 Tax=Corynespora cassiicola Philippines TaxID=1448308 RepID=A0A2T2NFS0_CORCC|nr:hypothetical protein BS50DRAFT_636434 [Corynespora cassiicola Philippines]
MAPFMLPPAIRFVAARGAKAPEATVQLLCHVKPGVHADREGIASVTSEAIQVCVAARAREGEANRAVRNVIAEALRVPKSNVQVAKGLKSREKTLIVSNLTMQNRTPEAEMERIRIILQESVSRYGD